MKFTQEQINKQCLISFTGINFFNKTTSIRGRFKREVVLTQSKVVIEGCFSVLIENGSTYISVDQMYGTERRGVDYKFMSRSDRFKDKTTICNVVKACLNKRIIKHLVSSESKRFKQRYKLLQKDQAEFARGTKNLLKLFGDK